MNIEDLDIDMERKEAIDDGFKYDIIAEFKNRQRKQNRMIAGEALEQEQEPVATPESSEGKEVVASGKTVKKTICDAIAKSEASDWLLALIAFLLFCILISK